MKIILTTAISGCGEKEYLNKWVDYCAEHGKKVKVFDVGPLMYQHANDIGLSLSRDNILRVDPDILSTLRSAVLKGVLSDISSNKKLEAVVINLHAFFYWDKCFLPAYDRFLSRKRFNPDMYITFIDDFRRIKERLNSQLQWRDQKLTNADILRWQNIEVDVTRGWAQVADKSFYAIATSDKQPVSTFYKLVFYPEIEPIYIAMPISHFREPRDREQIDKFIVRLGCYFAVFNPLACEIVGAASVNDFEDDERQTINHHVVNRDVNWFVRQSQRLIGYWPGPVSSPGLDHETHEAYIKGKDVWIVYLGKEASPFITHYTTRPLFRSEDEFFEFLDAKYPERKNIVW